MISYSRALFFIGVANAQVVEFTNDANEALKACMDPDSVVEDDAYYDVYNDDLEDDGDVLSGEEDNDLEDAVGDVLSGDGADTENNEIDDTLIPRGGNAEFPPMSETRYPISDLRNIAQKYCKEEFENCTVEAETFDEYNVSPDILGRGEFCTYCFPFSFLWAHHYMSAPNDDLSAWEDLLNQTLVALRSRKDEYLSDRLLMDTTTPDGMKLAERFHSHLVLCGKHILVKYGRESGEKIALEGSECDDTCSTIMQEVDFSPGTHDYCIAKSLSNSDSWPDLWGHLSNADVRDWYVPRPISSSRLVLDPFPDVDESKKMCVLTQVSEDFWTKWNRPANERTIRIIVTDKYPAHIMAMVYHGDKKHPTASFFDPRTGAVKLAEQPVDGRTYSPEEDQEEDQEEGHILSDMFSIISDWIKLNKYNENGDFCFADIDRKSRPKKL